MEELYIILIELNDKFSARSDRQNQAEKKIPARVDSRLF